MQEKVSLYFKDARSDKEYHAQLQEKDGGFVVTFQYGPRGGTLTSGSKTKEPVPHAEAKKVYDKLVKEKTGKGYSTGTAGEAYVNSSLEGRVTGVLPQLLNLISEGDVEAYLRDPAWVLQEKYDGNRRLAQVTATEQVGINRKGLAVPLAEGIASALASLPEGLNPTVDGEQMGSQYVLFDVLSMGGKDLRGSSYSTRLDALAKISAVLEGDAVSVAPTARTEAEKRTLYAFLKDKTNKREGAVFKLLSSLYIEGRPSSGGDQVKRKFVSQATCIVAEGRSGKRSVGIELLDAGGLRVAVGNVTIPPNQPVPAVGALVEIEYLYAFKGGSLFQPQCLRIRDDIETSACTVAQLDYKASVDSEDDDTPT